MFSATISWFHNVLNQSLLSHCEGLSRIFRGKTPSKISFYKNGPHLAAAFLRFRRKCASLEDYNYQKPPRLGNICRISAFSSATTRTRRFAARVKQYNSSFWIYWYFEDLKQVIVKMFLQYYLNETGDRVYTLKVSCFFLVSLNVLFCVLFFSC